MQADCYSFGRGLPLSIHGVCIVPSFVYAETLGAVCSAFVVPVDKKLYHVYGDMYPLFSIPPDQVEDHMLVCDDICELALTGDDIVTTKTTITEKLIKGDLQLFKPDRQNCLENIFPTKIELQNHLAAKKMH